MTLKHYIVKVLQHTHEPITLCKSKYANIKNFKTQSNQGINAHKNLPKKTPPILLTWKRWVG